MDKPHFQYIQGLSSAELRSGKMPKFPEEKEELEIMKYTLQPIAKGKITATSLECKSTPSNNAKSNDTLRPGNIFSIYAKCKNEGIYWYLVNPTTEQWVAAHYVQII